MVVSLYTTRVVLNVLGVEDFGIYNVVASVTILFAFLSHAMTSSSIRFLSFSIGGESKDQQRKVFGALLGSFGIIAIIGVVCLETIGLWLLTNKLTIPIERLGAAQYAYQCTIVVFIINFIRIPYHAAIIAYEQMSFYAILSIVEAVMKLLLAYVIMISPGDKLVTYSVCLIGVSIITLVCSIYYCRKQFDICEFSVVSDKKIYQSLLGFMGWSAVGGGAVLITQQVVTIVVNLFCGVIANAAMGIANQVGGAINSFVANFQTAFNPQLIKLYASNESKELQKLIVRSSLYSFYLFILIAIPFIVEAESVLQLWLGNVPEYAVGLCQLMLVYYMIDAIQAPLWMYINATGDIKKYTIVNGSLFLLTIPVTYVLLDHGLSVYWALVVKVICDILCCVYRLGLMKIKFQFPIQIYIKNVLCPAIIVISLVALTIILFKMYIPYGNAILTLLCSGLITLLYICTIGLQREDKRLLIEMLKTRLNIA